MKETDRQAGTEREKTETDRHNFIVVTFLE